MGIFERNFGGVQNVMLRWKNHGFGFVQFTSPEAANRCLAAWHHQVAGYPLQVRRYTPELMVGKLSPQVSKEVLRKHFAEFGTVIVKVVPKTDAVKMYDGFACISFQSAEIAATVLALGTQTIDGTVVEIKDIDEESANGAVLTPWYGNRQIWHRVGHDSNRPENHGFDSSHQWSSRR